MRDRVIHFLAIFLRSAGTSCLMRVLCTLFARIGPPKAKLPTVRVFPHAPAPPPPSAAGLLMSAARVVPSKRCHRSRNGHGPEDLLNG
ncbi:hypothetical protein DFH11DRAFT_1620706, partial [Phellopilus nigrolimitatus]